MSIDRFGGKASDSDILKGSDMKKFCVDLLLVLAVFVVVCASGAQEDMTREQKNKLLVEVAIGAMSDGDWELMANLYSPRFVQHGPGDTKPTTWTDFELGCRLVQNKLPTLRFKIEDIIAEGDKVAVRLSWSYRNKRWFSKQGNPDGDIGGTELDLFRIEAGRIAEEWCECDPKQYLRLLSAMKYMGKS